MKILVLSFYYPPDLCAGSFRCVAMAQALKKRGHDVEVITTVPNRYATFDASAPEEEIKGGISIHRILLPAHQSGMLDQARAFKQFAVSAYQVIKKRKYDALLATSSRLMTATLGALVARRFRLPLYLDIRDIFADTIGDVLPPKAALVMKPIFSLIERFTMIQAKQVNLVSQGFEPYFSTRYPNLALSYFTNGVDDTFINASPKASSFNTPFKVLYAGNIGEGQGLHTIIPSVAKLLTDKVQFEIIGDGGARHKLEAALKREGCTNVTISPPVERAALIKAYEAADILFLHLNDYPAFYKVLPSKVFEYAALGKPIWAGVSGYAARFLQEEVQNAAVFYPGNTQQACEVLSKLKLEHTPRDSFIKKYARETIMEHMALNIEMALCSKKEAQFAV